MHIIWPETSFPQSWLKLVNREHYFYNDYLSKIRLGCLDNLPEKTQI